MPAEPQTIQVARCPHRALTLHTPAEKWQHVRGESEKRHWICIRPLLSLPLLQGAVISARSSTMQALMKKTNNCFHCRRDSCELEAKATTKTLPDPNKEESRALQLQGARCKKTGKPNLCLLIFAFGEDSLTNEFLAAVTFICTLKNQHGKSLLVHSE